MLIYTINSIVGNIMFQYKQIWLLPETKKRFQQYVGKGQTADRALNELLNIAGTE